MLLLLLLLLLPAPACGRGSRAACPPWHPCATAQAPSPVRTPTMPAVQTRGSASAHFHGLMAKSEVHPLRPPSSEVTPRTSGARDPRLANGSAAADALQAPAEAGAAWLAGLQTNVACYVLFRPSGRKLTLPRRLMRLNCFASGCCRQSGRLLWRRLLHGHGPRVSGILRRWPLRHHVYMSRGLPHRALVPQPGTGHGAITAPFCSADTRRVWCFQGLGPRLASRGRGTPDQSVTPSL